MKIRFENFKTKSNVEMVIKNISSKFVLAIALNGILTQFSCLHHLKK